MRTIWRVRDLWRIVAVAGVAVALIGCVSQTGLPYPVTSNAPNPEPAPGYRVRCQSSPMPVASLFDARFTTGCQQIIPPASDQVIVRARG